LKRRPISIRDNFFELGGTSLLALHLMSEIRHHFGVRLPVSILFEAPSVERLAQVLRRPEHRSEVSPLVAIQPGSLDPPFFAIHPGGGSIAAYSALVRHLPPEQPFYALQARGRDGEAEPLATVEEMAASYVPAIRRTQPCGPYLIGGWSFGGQVALEVAQRLISAGEEVTLLAIFDQGPQVPERPADYDDSALLRDILPPGFSLSAEELRRLGPIDRQLEHLVEVGHRAGALPLGIGLPEAHSILKMLKVHTRASIDYQARPYPGRVTLYRAEEQHPDLVDDLTLGWNEYVLGGIEIIPVPGTHQTLMREPQVAVVAARLTECLNRARVGAKKGFT
ncbi:MAG: non-ribosomal peptide synthetase, partial [bacterium]|nr:non-ribosomal peptide synthetase [bacterium]